MKKNPTTIKEHFEQKYGQIGSESRRVFEEKSQAFMIAELVKDARAKADMTQEKLAQKLNVKRTYISKIERVVSDIRVSTLKKVIEEGLGGKLHITVEETVI
ncbi:helix-turn-helix transcriptional regulator [Algoriphagus sp. D3-2-R+10]|uniref:helix-turn-helix domain-containing protein n=1 Tax=Algoriphagus aurantiacus TaxID=3103948 RepID=UPI002B3EA06D|nr:helix-turn-helix transcriptional regulator [Algoriphagus sp. D3-2-R+10]MEB2777800.1 helix-turn-helix transcriptional regulator [Algoriphagus sp. D3-2-R+10]